jgi:3D (Asp-Asp-Asp) domain-containing protein
VPDETEVSLVASSLVASVTAPAPPDRGARPAGSDAIWTSVVMEGRPRRTAREQPVRHPEDGTFLGEFKLTYYWVAHEENWAGKPDTVIYDPDCKPIARVAEQFAARLAREGTGKLRDERVVNVAGSCDCAYSPCFFLLDDEKHRFGVGVLERPLSPFRSVAVDPSLVTIGANLYIPELDGLPMPGTPPWGGFVHDGCVVADDRGGAVRGQEIDLFMARKVHYQAFDRQHRIKRITLYSDVKRCDGPHEDAAIVDRNSI